MEAKVDIVKLRALQAAATKGKLGVRISEHGANLFVQDEHALPLAFFSSSTSVSSAGVAMVMPYEAVANAEYTAALFNAASQLLDEVEQSRAALRKVKGTQPKPEASRRGKTKK